MNIVIMLSTYNGAKYIDEQLESIYLQSISSNIMLFVRDDGSTDETLEKILDWKDRINISFVEDDERLGPAKSFWKLMHEVPDADYYAFVDQDDIWDNEKLKTAVNSIGKTNEKVLWFSDCRVISSDGMIISSSMHFNAPVLQVIPLMICGCAQGCSMVLNRQAFMYIKNKSLHNIPMHDIVIMLFILVNGKVIYEPKQLFSYRVHSNNADSKRGKGIISGTKHSIKKWFGKNDKNVLSGFAEEFLQQNSDVLKKEEILYLRHLCKIRKSIISRLFIINSKMTNNSNRKALRSFKIRTLLGII